MAGMALEAHSQSSSKCDTFKQLIELKHERLSRSSRSRRPSRCASAHRAPPRKLRLALRAEPLIVGCPAVRRA